MSRMIMLATAATLGLTVVGADRAAAAIYMSEFGQVTPLGNLDGGPLADSAKTSGSLVSFDVRYTLNGDPSGGQIGLTWSFEFLLLDPAEVAPAPLTVAWGDKLQGWQDVRGSAQYNYGVGLDLVEGDLIGTFSFQTLGLGVAPHDDLPDFALRSVQSLPALQTDPGLLAFNVAEGISVWDPILGGASSEVGYDLQAASVPLPASAVLLLGGLAGLAGLRRRRG